MKKLTVIFIAIFAMTFAFQNVNAQNQAEVSDATAGAKIVAGIGLSEDRELQFGEIVLFNGNEGGTVEIAATAAGTRTLNDGLINMPGDVPTSAIFTVTGDDSETFKITRPASITLTRNGGAETMSINTSISGLESGVTTSGGSYEFYIGGTLTIDDNQVIGDYEGDYTVTVEYE